MNYMNLGQLHDAIQRLRHIGVSDDTPVIYSVNMAEYEGGFERLLYVESRDAVFLDDGTMKWVPEYGIK